MTELDQFIAAAFASEGKQEDVNKVHLLLLRSNLFIPVHKEKDPTSEEPFSPLFAIVDDKYYLPVFDAVERLTTWAGEHLNEIAYVELTGHDLISGMHESVFLCLNIGTTYYKEFPPEEVKHLKLIEARIREMKNPS